MKMNIGENIKHFRMQKNITQEVLAENMHVSPAAVSKWERGETYPDIMALQPLAYYFGISIDELMGYDAEKINADIENAIKECNNPLYSRAKCMELVRKAYADYPDDYRIMSMYMWTIADGHADNDSEILLAHKDEFLAICDKLVNGCTDEKIRLQAWNMRAKLLHAEGKTDEALHIYKTRFADWYQTGNQKCEQLFSKEEDGFYPQLLTNLYELTDFAADKAAKKIFFDKGKTEEEKLQQAISVGNAALLAEEKTGESYFAVFAYSFYGRMQNDFSYRGGSDAAAMSLIERYVYAAKILTKYTKQDSILQAMYQRSPIHMTDGDVLHDTLSHLLHLAKGRRAAFLENEDYKAMLLRYQNQ